MEPADPFASLAQLCQISSSQQDQLSRCRFAGEPDDESLSSDDSGGIPVESAGILMLSVPDSTDENENGVSTSRDNDVFHTPPEESSLVASQENDAAVDVRGDRAVEGVADNGNFAGVDGNFMNDARAVDLGRDTDLGFSAEIEVTEKIEMDSGSQSSYGTNQLSDNKVIHFQSINFTIKEGESYERDGLGETPAKKLKIRDENLGLNTPKLCLGSEVAKTLERVAKSIEKLASPSKNSKNLDEDVVLERSRNTSRTKSSSSLHTAKKLSFESSPQNCFISLQNQQNENVNCVDKEFRGDRYVARKLQFHSATLESRMKENEAVLIDNEDVAEGYQTEEIEEESDMELEDNKAVHEDQAEAVIESEEIEDGKTDTLCSPDEPSPGVNSHERQKFRATKSIDDLDKFRYVRPTNNSNAQGEVALKGLLSTSNNKEMTVLDVLRELAKDYTCDPFVAKLSVLEAAKRGGMTFR